MQAQRHQVFDRAVALVVGEAVLRIFGVIFDAPAVAVHLGQYRGRGDRLDQGIAPDYRLGQDVDMRQPVAVDQYLDRLQSQAFDRALHREHGGLENVEGVDLLGAGLAHGATQRLGADLVVELGALERCECLGIGQAADRAQIVEDHGGGHHRPHQRAAAGFVDASHQSRRIPGQGLLLSAQ